MKEIYPSLFLQNGMGYNAAFPDFPGLSAQGPTLEACFDNAEQALGAHLKTTQAAGVPLPPPTPLESVDVPHGGALMLVKAASDRAQDERPVRRTVSLPGWMDLAAQQHGLSLSKVLQEALARRL